MNHCSVLEGSTVSVSAPPGPGIVVRASSHPPLSLSPRGVAHGPVHGDQTSCGGGLRPPPLPPAEHAQTWHLCTRGQGARGSGPGMTQWGMAPRAQEAPRGRGAARRAGNPRGTALCAAERREPPEVRRCGWSRDTADGMIDKWGGGGGIKAKMACGCVNVHVRLFSVVGGSIIRNARYDASSRCTVSYGVILPHAHR